MSITIRVGDGFGELYGYATLEFRRMLRRGEVVIVRYQGKPRRLVWNKDYGLPEMLPEEKGEKQ